MLERTYVLPTDRHQDVRRILEFRLSSDTPFLIRDLDWSWRIVGKNARGEHIVKVALVEKSRLRSYLEQCALPRQPAGVLVEDDFLAAYQDSRDREEAEDARSEPAGSSPHTASRPSQIHLYSLQRRLLASLVRRGTSLRSNVTSMNGHEAKEISLQEVLTPLMHQAESSQAAEGRQPVRIRCDSGLGTEDLNVGPGLEVEMGSPLSRLQDSMQNGGLGENALHSLPEGGWVLEPDRLKDASLARWAKENSTMRLLPESWRAGQRGRKLVRRLLLAGGVIVLACLIVRVALNGLEAQTRGDRLAVEEQRVSLKSELREVEAAQMLINRLEAGSGSTRMILSAWDQIARHVPKSMSLTSLVIQENGVLILHGTTNHRSDVGELIEALASDPSGAFRDVTLGGLEERRGQQQIFNIRAVVREGIEKEASR